MEADLLLLSDRTTIIKGQAIALSTLITPTTAGGKAIPFAPKTWSFLADDGTSATVYCYISCSQWPQKSGTFTVVADVNYVEKSQSVHITVLNCPLADTALAQDSLLKLAILRSALRDAFDSTTIIAPGDTTSKEIIALGVRSLTDPTITEIVFLPRDPQATGCSTGMANYSGTMAAYGNRLRFLLHGHNSRYDPSIIQTISCDQPWNNPPTVLTGQVPFGAGDADWRMLDLINNLRTANGLPPIPGFIIDSTNVYELLPGGSSPDETRPAATPAGPQTLFPWEYPTNQTWDASCPWRQ